MEPVKTMKKMISDMTPTGWFRPLENTEKDRTERSGDVILSPLKSLPVGTYRDGKTTPEARRSSTSRHRQTITTHATTKPTKA